jgi:hypothetical protein
LIEGDAKRLGAVLADMEPPVARAAMAYLRLFKPPKTALRLTRATKLLQEIVALIDEGTVCRDERSGVRRPAPAVIWVAGIEQMLQQAERLTLPLGGHCYLREVVYGLADKADAIAEREREQALRDRARPEDGSATHKTGRTTPSQLDNELAFLRQMHEYGKLDDAAYDRRVSDARLRYGDQS